LDVSQSFFLFIFLLHLVACFLLVSQLLPSNRELLHTAQERNWIPTLLSWLNLHDRPAVQVESLLALTSIAELCAQRAYQDNAAAAIKGGGPLFDASAVVDKYRQSLAPGSVPFPPLSFSQTLSSEAMQALDQSLTTLISSASATSSNNNNNNTQATTTTTTNNNNSKQKWTLPPAAPLFPLATAAATAGAINFSSLAPPPGGAHSTVPCNSFLPPPTPLTSTSTTTTNNTGPPNFPQQLSASSQHLLLRHADAIPTLISLLTTSSDKQVYEQAMWILGSIAAGDSTTTTTNSSSSNGGGAGGGGASSSNTLAASLSNTAATTSAVDATGSSVASAAATGSSTSSSNSKNVSARDVILAAGVMSQLLRCLEAHPTNISLQRIGSWTLSNLVDGIFQQQGNSSSGGANSNNLSGNHNNSNTHKNGASGSNNAASGSGASGAGTANNNNSNKDYSSADEIDMPTLLPVLKRLLSIGDSEVLGYTCWTLSHLCDGPSSHIAAVVSDEEIKGGLVPRLVDLLTHASWRVTKPALRTIGNIVCAECTEDNGSSTDYTEVILECNAVPRLKELVTHSNREIQKEACWTLSNIAAGTVDQIQAVINSGAIPPLVKLVKDKRTDQEVRTEACWVVLNATSCGSDSQIEILVDEGCVSVLGVLLSEASMVMMALEGLERVLQVEETREIIRREKIENKEIVDSEATRTPTLVSASLIEKARESHNSSAVTKRADRIWKQHFVSCALCKMSFSKHRISDASFCEECKCHVCSNCNCKIYHLDYQEELWAATEEETEAKKNAKKSKNKKKKAKLKEKKAKQQEEEEPLDKSSSDLGGKGGGGSRDSVVSESSENDKPSKDETDLAQKDMPHYGEAENEDKDDVQNQIDFVLYLEQTGSIIALAKLMDALEYHGDDFDEELSEYERRMIREQKLLRAEQANSAH
jgi:hypothetical protein